MGAAFVYIVTIIKQPNNMKKLILFIALVLMSISAMANDVSKADIDGAIGINVAMQKMDVSGSIADKMPIPVGDVHKPMTADLMFGKQALKTNPQQTGGKTRSISLDGKVATPRKAPTKTAVNVSGLIDASTLANNSEVVLTGNTTIYMDVNKTLKSISGDYTLTISGGNILTINNPNGAGIEVKSLNSTAPLNITARNNAIATTNAAGDVTINGNLTAETTGDKYFCIVGKKVTLIGGTKTITSVTNAVVSYGDMILGGDITASATNEQSGSFNTRDGGNLLIQEGSTINALSAGFGIYAAGNITMPNGSLTARGYSSTTVQSASGNISLTGTINVKGKDCAICAGDQNVVFDVTINGNLTAETTGDKYFCIAGKKVTLIGGTMRITSVTNAVVSYGNLKVTGNAVVTSTDPLSVALNSRDGGNIIFGKGDYKISGAGQAVYAAGHIGLNSSLAILTPANGKISGNTIVDSENHEATYVHIGYTPRVTQNTITTPTIIKYGEQVRIDGKITAVGQTTYKLQESADGSTWRTIKSGTIATNDARAGYTIQYKKVLVETGYEAYRQYRLIATHVASGEQDTSAIKRIYYKYPLLKDGLLTAYYSAGEVFHFAKPADCRDYRYTSQLPAQVAEYNDYLSITMPASSLYIDEYTPTYQVDFYDADATLLKTEEVIAGNDATPPSMGGHSAPGMRKTPSSIFTGWDKDYTNVHKRLRVFAKYDVYVNLDMDIADHTCNRTEDWKFASWMFTKFEGNKTQAMAGDQLTFRASVKTNTPVDVFFQAGTPLGNGDISWTTGTKVGEITGYDVNKVMTFDRQVTALVEYYNELPFEKVRYYRFYAKGNGTAETVYSQAMEINMYYPLLVNADQEVQVLTSDGGFYFNGLRSIIPVQYNETVLILDRQGMKGAGLTMTRVNKPAYLTEGYTAEGVHYVLGPGETETLNVTTTKKLIVFDGVYGNGYPKQLDFSAEGFGKLNGYYGEVVPCGGSVTMPADPTEENAIFLGWTSWDPSSYDSVAYLNVPAINENILGFTANFEYYDPTPQYTVRFYGKDGASLLDTQSITEGADATPPTAPAVSGWHFAGWDKPYTTITANTDITALYGEDIKVWTVTYKNWDGSSLGSEQVNDGEAATGVEVAREGYTFVKWRDYFSGDDVDMQHITANITVEPVFTETLYTVTYRVNGVETYTVQAVQGLPASSIYYPLGTPTKEPTEELVYTFAYWTPDVETITEDVTFEAVFVPAPREYTITFQNWDHTLLSEQQVAYGVAAVAPSVPARDGYFFDGWDRGFDVTLADMTVTAVFRLPGKYTISWLNDDASLIDQTVVVEGEAPTHANPTKPATAEFTYTFAGWTPAVAAVTGDATYTATYNSTRNSYTVTWKNDDGTQIDQTVVEYGVVPTHADPSKPATAEYTYTFTGWTPAVAAVTGDATYTATYSSTKNTYTVTWLQDDGSTIDQTVVEYGQTPTHADPTKPTTAEYTYTFTGWTPNVVAVTGNATYTATYSSTKNTYTVTWLQDDGTQIDQTVVEYGVVPTHADPSKPATAEYTYTFTGWTPNVVAVTGNATYTATYSSTKNSYTVTFVDYDGTELKVETVEYGQAATPPANPVRENYYFMGWDSDFSFVTEDMTVTATYKLYDPTDVDNISTSKPARKVMIDGQIFILRGDKTNTITGAEVK